MPRYAAIDIGSNSIRMLAAEVDNGRPPRILAEDRQVTRLGAGVFRSGQIDRESLALVCSVLERMVAAYRGLDVLASRVVATAAVRDASNREDFLERAAAVAGQPAEIISGQEEARLIHMGVMSRWPHPKQRILIVDVGGGSAEFILSEQGRLAQAYSRPLGAVRITEVFLKNNPPSAEDLHRMAEYIEEKMMVAVRRIGRGGFDRAVGTSASASAVVCAANRIPRARREEADRRRATTPQLRSLFRQVSQMDLQRRRKVTGIGPRRAEIIVPGVAVLLRALEEFGLPAIYYSAAGVRDGIVRDLADRGVGRELSQMGREQRQMVESMARRFGVDMRHAHAVAGFAHQLFMDLYPLHRLPRERGRLLEAAAYLRDVGHFISDTSHHKHSHYIVANSDLAGFTDSERIDIALMCRYHRKALPGPRHPDFEMLNVERKRALMLLTPLLRVADALDRSREQRVAGIVCETTETGVSLVLKTRKDVGLEQWAIERVGESFTAAFGRPLAVVRER
jgi:exopolyphosphatase / guanosine-5'-triphosphate,3'-diphosphate pyrophosphatase